MLKLSAISALSIFILSLQIDTQAHKPQEITKHAEPSPTTPAIAPQQSASQKIQDKENNQVNADVRVISTPEKDG